MFDLLKKKIAGFAEKIVGKSAESAPQLVRVEEKIEAPMAQPEVRAPQVMEEEKEIEAPTVSTPISPPQPKQHPVAPATHTAPSPKIALPEIQQRDERKIEAKIGITQKIGSVFRGTITLNADTVNSFLEEFELSLLEADVEMETTTALVEELRKRLVNKTISGKEDTNNVILVEIRKALEEIVHTNTLDVDAALEGKKPGVVLVLGPNGAGKTTTIAKLAHHFQAKGKKVVLASADTFRAGSIEQLQTHAQRMNVRVVKHHYGADPAAVAYDAVSAAKAEGADIVLIDTAGRQDTNKNLLEELKKINRVIQPTIKIYIGESYTGQAILTQAKTFDEAIGIDGFILTKLDTDTKGGGVLTILHQLHKPILFLGVGQGYEDLVPFSLSTFLERIVPQESK